jgi:hypothetical protein
MGFLDELKDKAEEFGDKAQEGFGAGKDNTEEVFENVKDRFDGDDDTPTLPDESVGYSSEGAEGIKEAVGEPTESPDPRSTRPSAPKRLPQTARPAQTRRDRLPHLAAPAARFAMESGATARQGVAGLLSVTLGSAAATRTGMRSSTRENSVPWCWTAVAPHRSAQVRRSVGTNALAAAAR